MEGLTYALVSFLIFWWPTIVCGQDCSVPSDWRRPSSNLSLYERLSIAQLAIQSLTPLIDTGTGYTQGLDIWSSANVPASLAQHDYASGTRDYQDLVSSIIRSSTSSNSSFFDSTQTLNSVVSYPIMWGLAAFYGARAYNDTDLLKVATDAWDVAQMYAVSSQDGANGTQPTRTGSFPIHCLPNVTSAGAVFWVAYSASELESNVITVGAYVTLSAHLWEATGKATYLEAAEQSASFIYSHLYSQSDQVLWDSYNLGSCRHTEDLWIHNQGFFLEGISILRSAPVSDKSTWGTLLQTLVVSTLSNPIWVASNDSNIGVLVGDSARNPQNFQDAFIWKNIFIRALYEIWTRSSPSSPIASLIQAFMMVQYNALIDLAMLKSINGDFYSPIWTGPQVTDNLPWGQVPAIEVLSAAIGMASNSNHSSSPTIPTAGTSPKLTPTTGRASTASNSSRSLSKGALAGIVGGCISATSLIVAGILLARRRRAIINSAREQACNEPEPFILNKSHISHLRRNMLDVNGERSAAHLLKYRRHELLASQSPIHTGPTAETLPPQEVSTVSSGSHLAPASSNTPGTASETTIALLVQQAVERLHVHEAPPSYTRQ